MNFAKQNQRQGGYDYGNYDYDYSLANSPQYHNMYQNQNTRRLWYNTMNQQQQQQLLYQQQQQRQNPSSSSSYGNSGYGSSGYGSSGPYAQAKNYGSYSAGYK